MQKQAKVKQNKINNDETTYQEKQKTKIGHI